MTDPRVDGERRTPFVARTIHRLSVLIILAWLALTVLVGLTLLGLAFLAFAVFAAFQPVATLRQRL